MDAHLRLKSKTSVIGSASDFAYKWSLDVGLEPSDAVRLALAVDEIVTDVVLHAFADEEGEFEIVFRSDLATVEVVVRELGEPFDPDRHRYNRHRAVRYGDFHGAGVELVKHFADDFLFLNKGKAGKEFRIVKRIKPDRTADIFSNEGTPITVREPAAAIEANATDPPASYTLREATPADAEDIAKLIFRTYGYTYANDKMYFPKKIELGFQRGEKFGVIVRTRGGDATGYFAVLRMPDTSIGEVAEVVVSPGHRRKGQMTRMLRTLIKLARAEGMKGLYGEAVTVHDISQRVNYNLGFRSTALLLADLPITRYKQLVENYPQDISAVIDFLMIDNITEREVFLPLKYKRLLTTFYQQLGVKVVELHNPHPRPAARTQLDVDIAYHNHNAVVIVRRFGRDFRDSIVHTAQSLREQGIHTIYVDLPLDNPCVGHGVETLQSLAYVFAGLMPLFHNDRDYVRMQHLLTEIDLDVIDTFSPAAIEIKKRIASEMQWITKRQMSDSTSV